MSENTILCKCLVCLNQNVNGVIVSMRAYNRHRKNQQKYLDVGETSYHEQNLKDIHHQDIQDMHQQENEYQQKDQQNLIDEDSDTRSFNFNEEDKEYYSDNNIDAEVDNEEYDDYENEEEEDDDDDDDDDDDEDEDDENENDDNIDEEMNDDTDEDTDEDIMQIDDKFDTPNKEIIDGLKLLHLKSLYNFTELAYNDILDIFTVNNISLYKIKKYLKEITGLIPVFYDICENSCICYTGQYVSCRICLICNSTR